MNQTQVDEQRYSIPLPKFLSRMFKSKLTEEQGATGTEILGGVITNEDSNTTKFDDYSAGIQIFDEMIDTEPTLVSFMNAVTMPILRAKASIVPASDDNVDLKIAEEVESNLLSNSHFTYRAWIEDVLEFLVYGFVLREKVFEVVDGQHRWKKFAFRKPETISKWNVGDTGELESVTQQAFKSSDMTFIETKIEPAGGIDGKIFHLAYKQRGDNYRGKSLLRPAYKMYLGKKHMTTQLFIQAERGATGIPRINFKSNNPTLQERTDAISAVQNLRSDAEAYLINTPAFEIDFIGGKDFFGFDLLPGIKYTDSQMVSIALASFLEQGKSAVGSYSMQRANIELFLNNVESIANHIEDIMNQGKGEMQHIRQLVDLNHATVNEYPKYQIAEISGLDLEAVASILETFILSGMPVFPEDWMYMRQQLGLQERDLDEIKEIIEGKKPANGKVIPAPEEEAIENNDFNVGDIVTRDGTDEHIVLSIAELNHFEVKCIKEPKIRQGSLKAEPWIKIGETEFNSMARYTIVKKKVFAQFKVPDGRGELVTENLINLENNIVNLTEIDGTLKAAQRRLKEKTRRLRSEIVKELVDRGRNILSKKNISVNDVIEKLANTNIKNQLKLVNTISSEAKDLFNFGRQSVREELAKQKNSVRMQEIIDDPAEAFRSIRPTTKNVVVNFIAKLKGEFDSEILRQHKTGVLNTRDLQASLGRISQNVFDRGVNGIVNESMGLGRMSEMKKQGVDRFIRSEVLDTNTCSPCADVDGLEFSLDSSEFSQFSRGVFDGCLGGEQCRGINIAIIN